MYSRPRYARYSSDFSVPENYSGNAFRDIEEENVGVSEERSDVAADEASYVEAPAEAVISTVAEGKKDYGFHFDVGKIFGGIGFEELLIIGLILLMAGGDDNNDIIVFLALLLFIK